MIRSASQFRRFAYWILAIGLVVATVAVALRPQPVLVDLATAERSAMAVTIDEDGVTRIRERYIVSTPLTGRLLRITFDVGDEVVADETVLARMEPTDPTLLDPREIAQAEARVRAAARKLESAKSALAKAEAAVQFAESEMGRLRKLVAGKASSESEFARAELLFRQATEDARSAGFAVDIAEYELQLERAALLLTNPQFDNNAGTSGDQTDESIDEAGRSGDEGGMELAINAPIDGRILRIYQESTTVVTAGSPLMEIGDPSDLEVVADVLSRDAVNIRPGAAVQLEHWGGERPLRGRVRLVEPSGFTKLSALGVEEQRVNVIIDLIDPPQQRPSLGDNFRVDCRITSWQADDVLQIPSSALFRVDGQWTVFVVRDATARETAVEMGHSNGRVAEILGGIAPGTVVVIHPGDSIQDGTRLAPR